MSRLEFDIRPSRTRDLPTAQYVLKSDLTANNPGYVTKNFGSTQTDFWLTFDIGLDADAVTAYGAHPTGFVFAATFDSGPNEMFTVNTTIAMPYNTGWHTVELHVTSDDVTGYYDGNEFDSGVVSGLNTGAVSLKLAHSRVVSTFYGAGCISYYRAVKVGSTRGSGDLFTDDFSTGNFALWDSNTGPVEIVPDPFFKSSEFGQPVPPTPKALSFTATDNGGGEVGDWTALRLDPALSEVWVEFDLAIPTENLAFWDPNGSGSFCTFFDDNVVLGGGSTLGAISQATETGPQAAWNAFGGVSNDEATPGAGIFYDQWMTCQLHIAKTGTTTVDFYADDTLYCTFTDAEAADIVDIALGHHHAPDDDGTKLVYIKNVKIGTTQHGTDLLSITAVELNAQTVGDAATFLIAQGMTGITGFPTIVEDPFP
jgi:hypothetical protein